jgi:hypothetical protein
MFDTNSKYYFGSASSLTDDAGQIDGSGRANWIRTTNNLAFQRSHKSAVSQGVLFFTEHTKYTSTISLRAIFTNTSSNETTGSVLAVLHDCVPENRKGLGIRGFSFDAATSTTFLVTDSSQGSGLYAYSHATQAFTLVTRFTQARVLQNNEAIIAVNGIGPIGSSSALVAVFTSNYRIALIKLSALSDLNIPTLAIIDVDGSDQSCTDFYPSQFKPTRPMNDQFSLLFDDGFLIGSSSAWLVNILNNSVHHLAVDIDVGGGNFDRRAISVDRGRGGNMIGTSKFALLALGSDGSYSGRVYIFNTSSHVAQNATSGGFDFPLQEASPLVLNTPNVPLDWIVPIRTSSLASNLKMVRIQAFEDGSFTQQSLYEDLGPLIPERTSEGFFSTYDNRIYQAWGDASFSSGPLLKKRSWQDTYAGPIAMTLDGTLEFLPMSYPQATMMPFATLVNSSYFVFVEKNGSQIDSSSWSLHLSVYDIVNNETLPLLSLCDGLSQSCTWLERQSNIIVPNRKRSVLLDTVNYYISNPICGNLNNKFTFFTSSSEGIFFQLGSVNLQSKSLHSLDITSSLTGGERIGLKGMKCFPGADGLMYIVTTGGVYSSNGTDSKLLYQLNASTTTNDVESSFLLGGNILLRVPTSSIADSNVRFVKLQCVGNLCLNSPVAAPSRVPIAPPTGNAPLSSNVPVSASNPPSAAVTGSRCRGLAPFRRAGLPKAVCIDGVWVFPGNVDIDRFRPIDGTKPIELEFPQKVRFNGNFRIRRRRRRGNLPPVAVAVPVQAPVFVAAPKAAPAASPVAAPVAAPLSPPVAPPVNPPVAAPIAAPVAVPVSSPLAAPTAVPVAAPVAVPVAQAPSDAPELPDVDPALNPTIVLTSINETHTIVGCAEFSGSMSVKVTDADVPKIQSGASFTLFEYSGNCEDGKAPSNTTETTFDGVVIDYGGLTLPVPPCVKNRVQYDERSMAVVFDSDSECNSGVGLPIGAQVGIALGVIAFLLIILLVIFVFRKKIVPSYRSAAGLKKMRPRGTNSTSAGTSSGTRSTSMAVMAPAPAAYAPVPAPAPAPVAAVAPAAAAGGAAAAPPADAAAESGSAPESSESSSSSSASASGNDSGSASGSDSGSESASESESDE